jgi:hypothetical protein
VEALKVVPAAELRQDAMYDDSGFLTSTPGGFRDAVLLPKIAWSNRRPNRIHAQAGAEAPATPPKETEPSVTSQ